MSSGKSASRDLALRHVARLRGLLEVLEELGASEVRIPAVPRLDRDEPLAILDKGIGPRPPTFAEIMAVVKRRAGRRC